MHRSKLIADIHQAAMVQLDQERAPQGCRPDCLQGTRTVLEAAPEPSTHRSGPRVETGDGERLRPPVPLVVDTGWGAETGGDKVIEEVIEAASQSRPCQVRIRSLFVPLSTWSDALLPATKLKRRVATGPTTQSGSCSAQPHPEQQLLGNAASIFCILLTPKELQATGHSDKKGPPADPGLTGAWRSSNEWAGATVLS